MKRSTDNRRSPAEIKADLYRHYGGMEHGNADMTDFRRPAYSVRHPKDGYADTQNMSTGQQNEAGYPESEYGNTRDMSIKQQNEAEYPKYEYSDTYNASTAAALIRAQGEQIREAPAQYVARKYGIRGDADGQH